MRHFLGVNGYILDVLSDKINVNHLTHKCSVIYECIYELEAVYVFSPKYIFEVKGGGRIFVFILELQRLVFFKENLIGKAFSHAMSTRSLLCCLYPLDILAVLLKERIKLLEFKHLERHIFFTPQTSSPWPFSPGLQNSSKLFLKISPWV